MGRPRKVSAPTAAGTPPLATEQAKNPKKNINGRIVVENTEPLRGPPDAMFPEWMLLINPFVDHGFKMHFLRRLDVVQEGRDLLAEVETRVCEAIYLKGPQIRFLDGNPPGMTVMTLFVDGVKVIDREPAEKFCSEDPKFDMGKFLTREASFDVFHAGSDTKEQERVGVFLANGSLVDVHVDTEPNTLRGWRDGRIGTPEGPGYTEEPMKGGSHEVGTHGGTFGDAIAARGAQGEPLTSMTNAGGSASSRRKAWNRASGPVLSTPSL